MKMFTFRQLFDTKSSTYTYLLGDVESKEAVLIDPVFEHAERDKKLAEDLGLKLKYVMNTHVHADHVTGTGILKWMKRRGAKSVISEASGATADVKVKHGDTIHIGERVLKVLATPGHTNGCVSYVFHEGKMVFTGDTLLIRGCGRTDFQEGCAKTLYNSIHKILYKLPDDYIVYPAHDYNGQQSSSIGDEKKYNPRLTKDLKTFKKIMAELNLPRPKLIDTAVPANQVCGLYNLSPAQQKKLEEAQACKICGFIHYK